MASPTLESFCGFLNVSQNQSGISDIQKNDNIFKAYNIVCIISSVLSIAGALIQVLGTSHSAAPSQTGQARSRRTAFETVSGKTQKTIISALAVADVLACFGILFRSALWLGDQELITGHLEDPAAHFDNVFCAVCSAWIHFFFLCTYFWTFSYAIDVYLVVCKINPKPWLYHLLSWGLSLILAFGGILPLYTPFLLKCKYNEGYLLPHYLTTYIPILFVMIINPVLYFLSARAIKGLITSARATFTDLERKFISKIKDRFTLVTAVFYVCWLPNIINGILLFIHHHFGSDLSIGESKDGWYGVFLAIWFIMAIVNPLQALLNSLVYRGCDACHCTRAPEIDATTRCENSFHYFSASNDENAPLLHYSSSKH